MAGAANRPLTEKQRAVMERIDRRVPIAMIADEMAVSETRINQHIRALKDRFEVENLNALVERYRLSADFTDAPEGPLRKPEYSFPQVADEPIFPDQSGRDDPGEIFSLIRITSSSMRLGRALTNQRSSHPNSTANMLSCTARLR